jgi:hypothetical protein
MFASRMSLLAGRPGSQVRLPDAERYRPMLRLLSDADLNFPGMSKALRQKMRAKRLRLFRGYLRCLAKDYADLLGGIREVLVESHVERPDLATALMTNRYRFALALCRIEISLQLHALGLGSVDVSGLVGALGALKGVASMVMSEGLA